MASKKFRPEEAVAKLRQVDVLVSQGQSEAEDQACIGFVLRPPRLALDCTGRSTAWTSLGIGRLVSAQASPQT